MLSSQKEARPVAQEVPQLVEPVSETERALLRWYRQCTPTDRAHVIRFVSVLAETHKH